MSSYLKMLKIRRIRSLVMNRSHMKLKEKCCDMEGLIAHGGRVISRGILKRNHGPCEVVTRWDPNGDP